MELNNIFDMNQGKGLRDQSLGFRVKREEKSSEP